MYLRDALHFFPPTRAHIRLDGAMLNDGSLIAGGRLYEDATSPLAPALLGRFHIGGRGLAPGIVAATYHAGVKVETCLAVPELALVDFPADVELTEGRDALKPGPAFTAVAMAFYRRLARIGSGPGATDTTKRRLAELAGQVSALMLQSAGWSEMARDLATALLGPDRFLVSADRADALAGFLGPDIAERMFVPESFWAERHWIGQIPGERELLERELDIGAVETLEALARRRSDLAGLAVLVARTTDPGGVLVSLARRRVPRPAHRGLLACLGTRRGILLREDAPSLRNPNGWLELYTLRASFDRACGLREADVERNLIVRDPLAFGG
jgi:hypothetical protein